MAYTNWLGKLMDIASLVGRGCLIGDLRAKQSVCQLNLSNISLMSCRQMCVKYLKAPDGFRQLLHNGAEAQLLGISRIAIPNDRICVPYAKIKYAANALNIIQYRAVSRISPIFAIR